MDVLMPQLGETVAEGKISKWFVSAGDTVKPGDNLFEIETDKVSMEVPAISAGMLAAIHVPAGETCAGRRGRGDHSGQRRNGVVPRHSSAHPRESGGPEPGKEELDSRLRGNERSLLHCRAKHRSRWSHSARSARPSATTARRGLRAARSSRRSRAASRARPASISRTSKAPARTAASWPADIERRAARSRPCPRAERHRQSSSRPMSQIGSRSRYAPRRMPRRAALELADIVVKAWATALATRHAAEQSNDIALAIGKAER